MAKLNLSPRLRSRLRRFGIVVGLLLLLGVIQPFLWRLVGSMAARLHENRSQLQQVADVQDRVTAARLDGDNQQAQLDQLMAVVPESKDVLRILERVEGIAQQLRVTLEVTAITERAAFTPDSEEMTAAPVGLATTETEQLSAAQPDTAERAGRIFPLVVTLAVEGSVEQLLDYLDAIEHVQELTQVQSFTLGTVVGVADPTESSASSSMTIDVVFYVQDQGDGEET